MLIPSSSALVLIEPAETQASHVSFDFACLSQRIIAVAALAGVPVLHAVYSPSMRGQPSVSQHSKVDGAHRIQFEPEPKAWATSTLGTVLAASGRNQVVVIGHWLEEAITLLVLNCLSTGLDAYVPSDLTPAITSANELAARARLNQAGAVPTSSEQIIREWAALHHDEKIAQPLLDLLTSIPSHSR
ncbi:MAG: isochorismatase family protein [Hyphomicrobiaceae bacterium]